jgi:hypothetical protein
MRVPAKPDEILEIYVDESSQTKHRYLVLGAVVVEHLRCAELCRLIVDARLPDLPAKEAKWQKVSRTKLVAYKRIVDVFFENESLVHFLGASCPADNAPKRHVCERPCTTLGRPLVRVRFAGSGGSAGLGKRIWPPALHGPTPKEKPRPWGNLQGGVLGVRRGKRRDVTMQGLT